MIDIGCAVCGRVWTGDGPRRSAVETAGCAGWHIPNVRGKKAVCPDCRVSRHEYPCRRCKNVRECLKSEVCCVRGYGDEERFIGFRPCRVSDTGSPVHDPKTSAAIRRVGWGGGE